MGNASGIAGGSVPAFGSYGSILALEAQASGYFGVLLSNSSSADGLASGNRSGTSSGSGASFYKTAIGQTTYSQTNYQTAVAIAGPNYGGSFSNYSTSGGGSPYAAIRLAGQAGSTYYSVICDTAGVYLNGYTVSPFTASHDALISNEELPYVELGDIVYDQSIIVHQNYSNTGGIATRTTSTFEPAVLGVVSEIGVPGSYPGIYSITAYTTGTLGESMISESLDPEYQNLIDTHRKVSINAVGEGMINVVSEGGNIKAGDYICSSSTPGKGMRQPDDLMHNYTVAKARESYTFTGTEVYALACSYHCG